MPLAGLPRIALARAGKIMIAGSDCAEVLRVKRFSVDYKGSGFERLFPEVIGSVEDYLCVVRYD